MEVTDSNFRDELPVIQKAIEAASFIAIDCEFTGLHTKRTVHSLDTPKEHYAKLRETALGFQVLQVGISTFEYDKSDKKYRNLSFSFYIRPWLALRGVPERIFQYQASSLQFLGNHQFDFNKAFINGVSYLKPKEAEKVLLGINERQETQLQELRKPPCKGPAPDIPAEHREFIDGVLKSASDFLGMHGDSEEELHFPDCDAYRRKLIYQTLLSKYAGVLHLETQTTQGGDARHVVARRFSAASRERELAEKHKAELESLEISKGFSLVLEKISHSGKLVVGHNMLLDLIRLLDQFVDDLPGDFEEFKAMSKACFPALIDTKVLSSPSANMPSFKSTALGQLLLQLKEKSGRIPTVEHGKGYGYDESSLKFHDAGHDAFATGLCLLGLISCLHPEKMRDNPELNATSAVLRSHLNKVYFMSDDMHYINLDGVNVVPNRSNVFYVTFPEEWKLNDLRTLFMPYGDVHVTWISHTEAAVRVRDSIRARTVLSDMAKARKDGGVPMYQVHPYTKYVDANARTLGLVQHPAENSAGSDSATAEPPAKRARSEEDRSSTGSSTSSGSCVSLSSASLESPLTKGSKNGPVQSHKVEVSASLMFEENDDWV
uniref:Poly(A)-specific ribonuclease PARN n=1 Tax=Ornithodoros turicata TaxID=34597 RepID=A0A2R5LNT9_9ACAR